MSFKDLWVPVSIVVAAMLPLNPASGWSLGVGHLPSCVYVCLDRSLSWQSSCQDLKCICNQPNLLTANEACFRKECDFNSQAKAFKLLATCKESFGITSPPPVEASTPPSPALSPQPATGYTGYPYIVVPAIPQQSPPGQNYAYPYTRVISPVNNSTGAALAAGTTIPSTGFPQPAAAVQPQAPVPAGQVSPTPTQPSAPPPQVSPLQAQAPTTAGAATNGTSKPPGINTANSTSNAPPFLSSSNASTTHVAGKAAWSSAAPSLFRHQIKSCVFSAASFTAVCAILL